MSALDAASAAPMAATEEIVVATAVAVTGEDGQLAAVEMQVVEEGEEEVTAGGQFFVDKDTGKYYFQV